MKLLHLTAAISAALISVLPNTCLSQTVVNGVKYPKASRTHLPNCYIETSDRRILDLTNICGEPAEVDAADDLGSQATTSNTRPSAPDRAAMYNFRESRVCDNENTESDQSACEGWAARKLPGAPY